MEICPLALPDVLLIRPKKFEDPRGFFAETYSARVLSSAIPLSFVQDNLSLSRPVGTLRGLHFQSPPHAQGKLVRCVRGRIFDVAVDIRTGSPTVGRHVSVELSGETLDQIYVPPGFAHGFCTLDPDTEVSYKVTDYYAPACDGGIAWDDPDIGIDWPVPASGPVLSPKDQKHPRLRDLDGVFRYEPLKENDRA
jgi:dTDP-4-dehydrorhamnose 3,5-epimerase